LSVLEYFLFSYEQEVLFDVTGRDDDDDDGRLSWLNCQLSSAR